jgi:hypothetical protein
MFCKNFIVFNETDDTRIQHLLNKLGLNDRIVNNYDVENIITLFKLGINYKPVFEKLKIFRKESINKLNLMINA